MKKIGVINFVNSIPLYYGLDKLGNIVFDTPRNLAGIFASGELDVAFIPSVDYLLNESDYCLVKGVSISSFGSTLSVRLFYKGRLEEVEKVCLSHDSSTSNFVIRKVLHDKYGVEPRFREDDPRGPGCGAFLMIGDKGLKDREGLNHIDLGKEWYDMTGTPMVYAVCVARTDELAGEVGPSILRIRDENLRGLDAVLAALGMEEYKAYIENLDYGMDNRHEEGLARLRGYLKDDPARSL